jgi:cysteinyl-tRNA synthetase
MDDSYSQNASRDYISFAGEHRELDNIPSYPASPYNENTSNIGSLTDARNFLYLIDPGNYNTKADFLNSLQVTNYDILLIDLFFDGIQLSLTDVASLKIKNNGGTRLVIGYMSIGEAEDYRYYWDPAWDADPPSWLAEENPDWPGNYKVRYWHQGWQNIISGNTGSYLKKILSSGFDGVYLDIIDAFEYFENQ